MRKRGFALAALAATALTAQLIPALPARAATTFEIKAGAEYFSRGVPGFSARFYPGSVRVQAGDTLHFAGRAPVLLPEGVAAQEFREGQASHLGDPYFLLQADPDDGERGVKINLNTIFPNAECGAAADDPCTWNGAAPNDILSLGDEAEDLWVTITAAPGSVIYATSLFGTRSDFRIEVVASGDEASSQAELDQRAAQLMRQDYNNAAALHNKFSARRTFHRDHKGRKVWDAWAGLDSGPVSLMAMYPKVLMIKPGQRVQWHFSLETEIHNVVLPFKKATAASRSFFQFVCDPDGDGGAGPDTPPDLEEPPFCNAPGAPEMDLGNRSLYQKGNRVFTGGKDFEGSGVRGPETLSAGFFKENTWTLKFKNSSPKKGFRYFCTVHGPFMGGKVRVR